MFRYTEKYQYTNIKLGLRKAFLSICSIACFMQSIKPSEGLNQVPLVHRVIEYVKAHPRSSKLAALLFCIGLASRQYYLHKRRPKEENITPEAKIARWEAIKNEANILKKIKLLLSFIDDFYLFCKRTKSNNRKTTTISEDGRTRVTIEDKEVIPGTGLMAFLDDCVFDKLEEYLKFVGTLFGALISIDLIAHGQLKYFFEPAKANSDAYTPKADGQRGPDNAKKVKKGKKRISMFDEKVLKRIKNIEFYKDLNSEEDRNNA